MVLTTQDITELYLKLEREEDLTLVRPAKDWHYQVFRETEQTGTTSLPWLDISQTFQLRPGELTLWGGESGSGKSVLVGQVISWALKAHQNALIASMEMPPAKTLERMLRQCCGTPKPSDPWMREWFAWSEGRLWIYDQLDSTDAAGLLKAVHVAAEVLGVHHVVIDSLTKCRLPQDGAGYLTAQTQFVDKLQWLAKHLGIHIHLVVHLRKPEGSNRTGVSKYDVRGASQITDLADNVLLLSRNKDKEAEQAKAEQGRPHDPDVLDEPDAFLKIDKQRETGEERTFGLQFLQPCNQFVHDMQRRRLLWGEPWLEGEQSLAS
jgi:twinkle protein